MAWTEPDLNDFLPGQPFTSAKALLMVENPIAIADGASGAPRVARSVSVGTTSFAVPSGYSGAIGTFRATAQQGAGSPNRNLSVAFSDDDGGSYAAAFTVALGGSDTSDWDVVVHFFVDTVSGSISYAIDGTDGGSTRSVGTGSITLPAGTVDRVSITAGSQSVIFAELNGGTAAT